MKQWLQSVNHEQSPIQITLNNKHNEWLEILDFQRKLFCRTPTKIHRERRRRHQEAARKAQRTSLSTAKATSSTQRPQACTEAATKYYNHTANGADEEREHRPPTLKKRWGDQATLTVYSKIVFDATTRSNSYTICTIHVKNIFPEDWRQSISLYTMSNIGFTVSFILQWTVYNTVTRRGKKSVTFVNKVLTEQNLFAIFITFTSPKPSCIYV